MYLIFSEIYKKLAIYQECEKDSVYNKCQEVIQFFIHRNTVITFTQAYSFSFTQFKKNLKFNSKVMLKISNFVYRFL